MRRFALPLAALVLIMAPPVQAQTAAAGPMVSASLAAAVMDGQTSAGVTGFVGYRLNRVLGMGVELTWVPDARDDDEFYPFRRPDVDGGEVLLFTTNIRVEVPTTSARIIPFAAGGGGLASIRREYAAFPVVPFDTLPADFFNVIGNQLPPGLSGIYQTPLIVPAYTDTTTGLALTLGGGASFVLTRQLSADVDLRYVFIRGNVSDAIGRFGAGISARF